jgi:drug/metabolite transporter (DMT)-like permease
VNIVAMSLITTCFYYAAESGVNPGVLASVFSSNIMFTSIIFYLLYGERITKTTVFCMIIMILGVFFVSAKDEVHETGAIIYEKLILAVVLALAAGFDFACSTLLLKHFVNHYGFSVVRFNVDG